MLTFKHNCDLQWRHQRLKFQQMEDHQVIPRPAAQVRLHQSQPHISLSELRWRRSAWRGRSVSDQMTLGTWSLNPLSALARLIHDIKAMLLLENHHRLKHLHPSPLTSLQPSKFSGMQRFDKWLIATRSQGEMVSLLSVSRRCWERCSGPRYNLSLGP